MNKDQISKQWEDFLDFISYAPISFMLTDTKGKIKEVNRATSQCTGYSEQELLNMNVAALLPQAAEERTKQAIHTLLSKGFYKEETEILTKDGSAKTLSISMMKIDENGIISFAEDITERKNLERINKKRKKYAEAIIDISPNAIATLDANSCVTGWNHKAVELFHYKEEEVLGKTIDECIAFHDKNIYNEALSFSSRAHSGVPVEPIETIRYTKEGSPLHLIVSGSPLIIDGEFEGVVATYTDISRSKQKEKEVETLLEEKEHLLHEVHHRIKNHMNTISSIISLRANGIDDLHIKGVLEDVQTKMRLMQNIYQSLYIGVDIGNVYISSFLSPLIRDIRAAYIYSRSISITTDIEEIEITSKQSLPVGIIITELITNSIKYAFPENDRGEIHLSIHKDQEKTNLLCIEVSDNGNGMPPEIVEQGKYGFGLTLVEGYTVQFDGTMSIRTEAGTTVRVALELE
ncbi:MAG: PAS domain S-box protein [Spirochaetia bacterium]|nr:PAS domain S-box protein [Spirochaetia bacterium]